MRGKEIVTVFAVMGMSAVIATGVIILTVQLPSFFFIKKIDQVDKRPVALVLGAALKEKKPTSVLEDRLEAAKELYDHGKIQKIILSGDNREVSYNEPEAMRRFLVKKGVSERDLVLDYAGRRTYDSCYRLRHIFGQDRAIIVTQRYHLPRALFLCRGLGVSAVGVSADRNSYPKMTLWYLREMGASIRAFFDITFVKPKPILGEEVDIFK